MVFNINFLNIHEVSFRLDEDTIPISYIVTLNIKRENGSEKELSKVLFVMFTTDGLKNRTIYICICIFFFSMIYNAQLYIICDRKINVKLDCSPTMKFYMHYV